MQTAQLPPTTAIADVLRIRGLSGCLAPPLHRMTPVGERAAGAAVTVRFEPGTRSGDGAFDELYALLSEDLHGRVVVLAGASSVDGAVWGQILSRAAAASGAAAVVIAGAVRDQAELCDEGVPVFAEHEVTPGATGMVHVDAVGVPVRIGDAQLAPGDTVVVDGAGAVCIPSDSAERLLDDARLLAAAEERVLDALRQGEPLVDAYRHKRDAVRELRTNATVVRNERQHTLEENGV